MPALLGKKLPGLQGKLSQPSLSLKQSLRLELCPDNLSALNWLLAVTMISLGFIVLIRKMRGLA